MAEALFAKNIFTKTQSAHIIETIFELIKQSLQNGEDVLISGFGKFSVKEKYERNCRNPQTGEPMMPAPGKVVTFKCSGVLRTANEWGWGLKTAITSYRGSISSKVACSCPESSAWVAINV
ncbi:MAG: integration host factor subunit alpha [Syntrophobacteraceae bacterium]